MRKPPATATTTTITPALANITPALADCGAMARKAAGRC